MQYSSTSTFYLVGKHPAEPDSFFGSVVCNTAVIKTKTFCCQPCSSFPCSSQPTEAAEEVRIEDRDVPQAHRQVTTIIR